MDGVLAVLGRLYCTLEVYSSEVNGPVRGEKRGQMIEEEKERREMGRKEESCGGPGLKK